MMSYLASIKNKLVKTDKYQEEAAFWREIIKDLQLWYQGELTKPLYGHEAPKKSQRVVVSNLKDSAILTWLNVHQKPKYLKDLGLKATAFKKMTVLDIGAGPIPSGLGFTDIDLYCLDPLYDLYLAAGYPIHYYDKTRFIKAFSEDIPLVDNFFDAVISANAIDHVDDLEKTSQEIKRVLKKGGKFAMHVHYHKVTPTEPLEITDEVFKEAFKWCKGLKKISEGGKKYGSLANQGEKFVLWRNF